MYDSLRRRGGANRPADAHARRVPADLHEGTARDFLRRHEHESADAARANKKERANFASCFLRRAADSRNLFLALDHLASEGGEAPGPDGMPPGDLSLSERWDLARSLSRAILSETYRPGPHREVRIPKGGDRGFRTLQIQDVQDRAVQRGLVQVLQPFLDPRFSANSFGSRPGKGREHALARAESLMMDINLWVWDAEDIRDAFDQVPLNRLMDVLRKHIQADDLLELVMDVIGNAKGRGLRQGGALSPLFLNPYLSHVLDRPWERQHLDTPLLRVVDDLLVLNRDRDQAAASREALKTLLEPAGMPLNESKGAIRDLTAGQAIAWLGYELRKGDDGLEHA